MILPCSALVLAPTRPSAPALAVGGVQRGVNDDDGDDDDGDDEQADRDEAYTMTSRPSSLPTPWAARP